MHEELDTVPDAIMKEAYVIVDEGHLVLRSRVLKKLLMADRILLVSATFGAAKGLLELKDKLSQEGACVATINPTATTGSNSTTLHSIPFDFSNK